MSYTEHPFAQYVRILGKGKHSGRALDFDEAYTAFTLLLKDEVTDLQRGAFLLLLRVRGENADELAGFARASRDFIAAPTMPVTIDWPSYAGKHQQLPWFLLSAFLLASRGINVFMHGSHQHFDDRLYTHQVLERLGIPACSDWTATEAALAQHHYAYMPLAEFCPALDHLFSYRPLLGVRSPANSLVKLVNPLGAELSLQSVFHPAYLEVHQQASLRLSQARSLVMKGEGGEVEFRPDADQRLYLVRQEQASQVTWSRRQSQRQARRPCPAGASATLLEVWQGRIEDHYAHQAICGTSAMILFALGRCGSEGEAWETAEAWWQQRNKDQLL